MSDEQRKFEKQIDDRLDQFNASAALDGKELSEEKLKEIKDNLKSGMTPEEGIKDFMKKYFNTE